MTPQQLTTNLNNARLKQFGADQETELFPDLYFQKDVITIAPNGETTPRNPRYCATDLAATEVLQLFTDNPIDYKAEKIVYGNAIDFSGLMFGWSDNKNVPYIQFSNGGSTRNVNVGLILDYFNHGKPATDSWASAVNEVNGAFQN